MLTVGYSPPKGAPKLVCLHQIGFNREYCRLLEYTEPFYGCILALNPTGDLGVFHGKKGVL